LSKPIEIHSRARSLLPTLVAALPHHPTLSGVPEAFLIAWIQKESGGDFKAQSNPNHLRDAAQVRGWKRSGERGLFQVMASTAKGYGWDEAKFLSLSNSERESIDGGLEEVAHIVKSIESTLRNIGVTSRPSYFWHLVKLMHGLPLFVKYGTTGFNQVRGRAPSSWEEIVAFLESNKRIKDGGGHDWRPSLSRILDNAESVGLWADPERNDSFLKWVADHGGPNVPAKERPNSRRTDALVDVVAQLGAITDANREQYHESFDVILTQLNKIA